jgi:hypothetical protein
VFRVFLIIERIFYQKRRGFKGKLEDCLYEKAKKEDGVSRPNRSPLQGFTAGFGDGFKPFEGFFPDIFFGIFYDEPCSLYFHNKQMSNYPFLALHTFCGSTNPI